jgi:hypothetical protein
MKTNKDKIAKAKKDHSNGNRASVVKSKVKKASDDKTLAEDQGNKLTVEDASILLWERDVKKSKGADEEL